MSSTQLALPQDIPAYIREQAAKNAEQNKEALGGIKAGSFPRISIGGSNEHCETQLARNAPRSDSDAVVTTYRP